MVIVELDQQNQRNEWLEWRRKKVCASDIPIILGVSHFKTVYELWREKTGFSEGQADNYAMKRGRDLEPFVRDLVNRSLNAYFEDTVMVSSKNEWAAASLDGYDLSRHEILEIKCPKLTDHKEAKKNKVPGHYYPQVQWQLYVSGCTTCWYASFYDGDLVYFPVKRDDSYIEDLLVKAKEFLWHMRTLTEPERSADDYLQINDAEFEEVANAYKEVNALYNKFKKKRDILKEQLISCTDDSNCEGFGVRLTRVQKKSMNWKSFYNELTEKHPDIKDEFPKERFVEESIGYWKISVKEKDDNDQEI